MTLGPIAARAAATERLADERFDLLVVGGGITGAGAALDAAARGMRVALVDRDDLGAGTSSRSSKLVHGGLRYLRQRELGLVRESLAERRLLLANAPHLVRPQRFLVPLLGDGGIADRAVARTYSLALWAYDLAGGRHIGHLHRRVDRDEARDLVPALDTDRLVAGLVYDDARADDARLVLTIARTAQELGAALLTHTGVEAVLHDPRGRVTGARLSGGLEVRADCVLNAAGVWAAEVDSLDSPGSGPRLRPARGVHLTFPRSLIPCETAAVVPVAEDGRGLFILPWGDRVYVGTTDTDHDGPLDEPLCTAADIAYVVRALNASLRAPVGAVDVVATWAGLRPLVAGTASAKTADISRRHTVATTPGGMVTIVGGKLTTYRRMAAEAVDAASERLGRRSRSATRHLELRGACDPADMAAELRRRYPALAESAQHLARRHGTDAPAVARLALSRPLLAEPLVTGLPYLRAEAVWAVREEMAMTVGDVLDRRTRARLLDRAATAAAAPEVGRILGGELGWDDARVAREVDAYVAGLRREAEAAGARLPEPSHGGRSAGAPATVRA
ncbi:MAG TPA: glycerol-3-phosphate dehydrogenase/oxidase [Candidatus Dormibacteraeota bacterium]|nr:glycerol-3-phosphate dehydrogenase/oxidase [Candidatus Dormibacteraeota bacterium]